MGVDYNFGSPLMGHHQPWMSQMRPTKYPKSSMLTVGALAMGLVVVLPSTAKASGYAQGLQGAGSGGVAGAVTGRPDVPEAGYYNPAGWTIQDEWGFGAGSSVLLPMVHHDTDAGERTHAEIDGAFPPFMHAFGSYGDFAAGVSLGVPYGTSLQWPEDWPGRFEATAMRLQAWEAAPSVAWQPHERFAVGAGPRLVWASLGFERFEQIGGEPEYAFVELDASTGGIGAQLGVWGDVHEHIDAGFSWRSRVDLDFEGTAQFEQISPEMQQQMNDTGVRTDMILPHRFAAGIAYQVAAQGTISLDVEYSLWGANDVFEVRFDSDDVDDIVEQRNWNNTLSMRAGAEYVAPFDGLSVRSGVAFEPSPVPEQTLTATQPDTDRTVTSFGIGYRPFEGVDIDVAYNLAILSHTTAADEGLSGAYDGLIHAFTLGVRARPGFEGD